MTCFKIQTNLFNKKIIFKFYGLKSIFYQFKNNQKFILISA